MTDLHGHFAVFLEFNKFRGSKVLSPVLFRQSHYCLENLLCCMGIFARVLLSENFSRVFLSLYLDQSTFLFFATPVHSIGDDYKPTILKSYGTLK